MAFSIVIIFGMYLLYQNFLVTFVSISDNLLSLLVMFTIVFGVALPKFSLFLVQLIFVVLLLFLLFDLTVQISTDILFLFSSEFLVF